MGGGSHDAVIRLTSDRPPVMVQERNCLGNFACDVGVDLDQQIGEQGGDLFDCRTMRGGD